MKTLQQIGEELDRAGLFTGGPVQLFESASRLQISTLLRVGLHPHSKVLDIGCGALRAGYWLVRVLDADCYFGIEPSREMLQAGIQHMLTPQLCEEKRPKFSNNDQFDFSEFGTSFDVFLARSVWSHASKAQIATMLDGFIRYGSPTAFFLTSFLPSGWFKRDYKGAEWKGKSHLSTKGGQVRHSRKWIEDQCKARALKIERLSDEPFNGQYWLKIVRKAA